MVVGSSTTNATTGLYNEARECFGLGLCGCTCVECTQTMLLLLFICCVFGRALTDDEKDLILQAHTTERAK